MKFDKEKMRLYAITDRHWLNGRSLKEVVKESLDGGVTFLQLRDKNSDDETFLQEAAELQELCRDYKVPLIINDNVEIALKMNADGVHVGQSDIKGRDIRAMIGPDKILGISAGTVEEAQAAEKAGADQYHPLRGTAAQILPPLLLSHPDGGGDFQAAGSVAAQTAARTKPLKLNIPNTLRTSPCLPGSFYRRTYAHS